MRVLVTRPREDFARTAEVLAAAGHVAVGAPLFAVKRLPAVLPDAADAVLAASANAIRMADPAQLDRLGDAPCFAVGAQTAFAARAAGFRDVRSADGDAVALASLLRASIRPGAALLHLAGRPRRDEAIAALRPDYQVAVAETYETLPVTTLPEVAVSALRDGNLDAVMHLSPRATRIFAELADEAGVLHEAQALLHVVISPAAVDPRLTRVRIARHPDLESVIAAL
jgi:uroporphyrinogen-III synthase